MTMRKSGYGFGSRRRTMTVEPLEGRAMLAGNVSVSVTGGSLFVRGDNSDNLVLIQQVGDGQYAVSGFDAADSDVSGFKAGPTRINGSANGTVVVSGVTGDINVDLKKGNDAVGLGNSVDDLLALADECGFGIGIGDGSGSGTGSSSGSVSEAAVLQQQVDDRFFVPRNLIINTGDGNDGIAVNADVEGIAVINAGSGSNGVALGNTSSNEDDVNIGGDITVLGSGGSDNICIQFVRTDGLINVQSGNGSDTVDVSNFDAGHVVVGTGNGNDFVALHSFDTDREVVVTTAGGNDTVFLDDFSAGQGFGPNEQSGAGYVTVVTGAGNDNAELTGFEADGVVVDTGAGNDGTPSGDSPITVADATIDQHLIVNTGAGNDLVQVLFVQAGTVVIDTGAGNDGNLNFPIEIGAVEFDSLTVLTGAGNDAVSLHGGGEGNTSSTQNNVVVNLGSGNDQAQIIEQQIGNDLTVLLGAGNDQVEIGQEEDDGSGEAGINVNHNLLVDAGAGNDGVGIGNAHVLNDLFTFLGAGNDLLGFLTAEVGGNALIDAGSGNDQVALLDSFVDGDVTILMGAGNDTLSVAFSGGNGRLIARGGPGRDTFNNDLGITSNGTSDDLDIQEFEIFHTTDD